MSRIKLAFTPGFDFKDRAISGTAGQLHDMNFSLPLVKTMMHRRLYLWHTVTGAGTWTIDANIVFRCGGQIVGKMPYRILLSGNNNNIAIGASTIASPNTQDMLRVQLSSTNQSISPFNIIVAADNVSFEGTGTNSGVPAPRSYFGIFSQHYW